MSDVLYKESEQLGLLPSSCNNCFQFDGTFVDALTLLRILFHICFSCLRLYKTILEVLVPHNIHSTDYCSWRFLCGKKTLTA